MASEAVSIRHASNEDLPGIMRLQGESYPASIHEPVSLFERIIGASPDTCLAAESEGVLAGYLVAHPIPDDFEDFGHGPPPLSGSETALYLHDACVGTAHRNQGVGRLLFDVLNAHLESNGFTTITAIAVQDSEAFWEKCGFAIGAPYTYPGGARGHIITRACT
jgi:ribosomal protein S18 acetylase RimI-like enzyme